MASRSAYPREGRETSSGKDYSQGLPRGGQVHLAIIDDGKGIDYEVVGRKCLEKGLVTHQQLESMSEKDILKMIFRPGFSTAQVVTSVSGRGVGMDVVRTNIERLGERWRFPRK